MDSQAPLNPCWIHSTAVVLGDVTFGADVSVWPGAVVRGDVDRIEVGSRSNIQDGAVIHCDHGVPTLIGEDCVIGHRAVVHGSVLEDAVLIGMGAIVLNGCRIGTGSIVGAGCVVTQGTIVPPYSLVLGVPGKVVRQMDETSASGTRENARRYSELKELYRACEIRRHA